MCEFLVFFRLRLLSCLLLIAGSLNVYSQISQTSTERPFHKGSNKQIIRTVLFSEPLQKQSLPDTRSTKTADLFTSNVSDNHSISSRTFTSNGAINVTVTTKGSTCEYNNGSIIVVASGGTPPYTYDIGNGFLYKSGNFPQVLPGAYKVIVTDNAGQKTSVDVVVGNTYPKPKLDVASYKRASGCAVADASVTLQASGGTPPYKYSIDGMNYQSSNVFINLYGGSYILSAKDANGCVATYPSIFLSYLANFNCDPSGASYSLGVCANEGLIAVKGMAYGKTYTYSIDGINYQSSGEFPNLTSGLYTIYIKDQTGSVMIFAIPLLQNCYIGIDYISIDAACQQNDGTLTVTASNGTAPYTYTIDGINYQSSNEFTGLAPGTYFITVRDANGFTNSLAATVYDRCPAVSASVTDETCVKNDGTIKAIPDKGTSPYQYSIDGVHFQNSTDFTGLAAGSYTVTIRDANGFTSTANAVIKNACLQVSAQTINTKCGANNGSITASATNGTAPYQYSIDGVNFQPSNTFTNLKAGTYTVTAKDWLGKTGNTIVKIFDAPAPTVAANSSSASCSDDDGTLTITGSGGTLPFSYSIDGMNFEVTNVFNNLKSGSSTAYIKDGNGCISSTTTSISIDCPVVSATITDETCGSKNGIIEVAGSGGTPPYQYSIDGTNFSSNPNFSSLISGNYTITIKDALGVANTLAVFMKNVCPTVTATVVDGKCTESGGIITAEGSNGYPPYLYSIDGINYQQSNVFSNLPSDDYTLDVKDSHGLMNSTVATVHNSPSPQLVFNSKPTSCLNNDGQISIGNNGGTPPFTYSIDAVSFQSSNVFDKISKGDYTAAIKDVNGCTDMKNITVGLNDDLSLDANKQIELCEGTSAQLTVLSNATAFNWSPQKNISAANNQNPTVSPSQTTMYYVTATMGICSKEDSILVEVNPAPVAIAQKDTILCYGQSVALLGSGGFNYSWSPITYLDDPSSATPVVTNPKSSIAYSLKVADGKGCFSLNQASIKIIVTPPAELFAGNDTSIVMGQPFQLKAQDINNSGFINYSWSPSDGLNNAFIQSPTTVLDHNIVYTVSATTQAGCEGVDEIAIKVYKGPDIFVPNAFTPNGDGLNDVLRPIPVGVKQFKYFAVYNRYGEKIFYSSDPNKGWNGSLKNQAQKTNVFVWLAEGIDDKGNTIRRKGTVVAIR